MQNDTKLSYNTYVDVVLSNGVERKIIFYGDKLEPCGNYIYDLTDLISMAKSVLCNNSRLPEVFKCDVKDTETTCLSDEIFTSSNGAYLFNAIIGENASDYRQSIHKGKHYGETQQCIIVHFYSTSFALMSECIDKLLEVIKSYRHTSDEWISNWRHYVSMRTALRIERIDYGEQNRYMPRNPNAKLIPGVNCRDVSNEKTETTCSVSSATQQVNAAFNCE